MTDVDMIPAPPPLKRHCTNRPDQYASFENDTPETPQERLTRYLQYECNYKACKYKDPTKTWGEIIKEDYPHFVDLMTNHVPLQSQTFAVLKAELHLPDQKEAEKAVRFVDTEEEKAARTKRYLELTCQHNGRMKNKKWKDILSTDYEYFMWAVGNTMGRETRTFNTFVECLKEQDKVTVLKTPKGKVVVPKKGKAKPYRHPNARMAA